MKHIVRLLTLLIILSLPLSFNSCSKYQMMRYQEKQRHKKTEKEKEKKEREAQMAYDEAIQKHYSMQDQSTKKMMKQTARKSYNHNYNKKECFLKRWFTPKQKKTKSKRKDR